jgi:ectoine hydroxylase-related dioxygenase (phytanoyl-CoA dioxygenase family)
MQSSDSAPSATSSGADPVERQELQSTTAAADATDHVERYGVHAQTPDGDSLDHAVETIRLLGYAVIDSGFSSEELEQFAAAFERAKAALYERNGGRHALEQIDEHNTIRAPMAIDPLFLELARNEAVLTICRRLIGDYIVLNQQNGIINPPSQQSYNQGAFHRDLPFQHFVSTRPLALNALFCLDEFTPSNGATYVVPASHKEELFPSDSVVRATRVQVCAPAGSYILLDGLTYHSGAVNQTELGRRAVNHLYTVPIIRPQIDLPAVLGPEFASDSAVRRLLGYELGVPTSVEAYYTKRRRQLGVVEPS